MLIKKGVSIFLLYFLYATVSLTFSQSPTYIHYTTFDGLPSQVVYSVLQDNMGFMWFGTSNGLCRFDGKNFKTYTTDDGLPDNEVLQLYQDRKGRIWLSLFNGGACYFYENKFYTQLNDSSLAKITGIRSFTNYFFPKEGNWFIVYGGKKTYTLSDELKIIASYDEYEYGKTTSFPFADRNMLFTSKKMLEFKNGVVVNSLEPRWIKPSDLNKLSYQKVILNRNYFINFESKLLELNIYKNDTSYSTYYNNNFEYQFDNMIVIDSLIYVTTFNSVLLRYHLKDSLLLLPEIVLKGKTFNRVYKDKEGGLWVTSIDDGIYYIPTEAPKVYNEKNGLDDNGIYSVFEFKKAIYFTDSKGNVYSANPFKKVITLGDNSIVFRIRQVVSDNTFIYMATDRGIFKADVSTGKFEKLFRSNTSKDIIINDGIIYYASNSGLFKIIGEEPFSDTLSTGRKTCLAVDAENNIWFGELNGLYRLCNDGKIIDHGSLNPLLKTRIIAIKPGGERITWIATQASGLIGVLNDNVQFVFNKANGLFTNNLKNIYINKDNIYVASDKGVDIINYKKYEPPSDIEHIRKFNGLASDDVNCLFVKEDTLYAGTSQGFSIIPLNLKPNKIPPSVLINDIQVNNQPVNIAGSLTFPYNQNSITINYIGISFRSAGDITYRYRLFSYEPWAETKSNSITFAELAPGNYSFMVDAQNASGYWSNKPASFVFTIEPPFWKRIRFITGASFVAAGLIAMAYYYRLKKFRKELQTENRMLQSEIKALRAQMNPHFLFNSLNSIQQYIFKNKKEEANEYLSEFAKLMRMMLDHSQENFIAISEELDFIKLYLKLEMHRLSDKFTYQISFNNEREITSCYIPSMVLQPFIENAIVHGLSPKPEGGFLELKFELLVNDLRCSIVDNGVGRKNLSESIAHKHSFAIKATQDRINAINAAHQIKVDFKIIDLTNSLNQPAGTLIEINFPDIKKY